MKKLLLLITLAFNVLIVIAQSNSGKFEWSFNTGGGTNHLKCMHYNSAGDLLTMITIGDTAQFGSTIIGAPKYLSYHGTVTFIGKRTQAGVYTVLVKQTSNTSTTATFEDFTLDANDNIIVSGTVFNASTPFDFGNGVTLVGKGYFIAKYNAAGQAQWAKLYDFGVPFTATNKPVSLGVLPNNDIYFAAKHPYGPFWLVKLNTNGTEVWHKELNISKGGGSFSVNASKNNFFFDNKGTAYFYVPLANSNYLKVNNDSIVAPPGAHPSTVFLLSIDGNGNKKQFTAYRGGIGDIAVEKQTGNVLLIWSQYVVNPAPFNNVNYNVNSQYAGIVALDSMRNYIKSTAPNFLLTADINSIYPLGNFKFVGSNIAYPTSSIVAGSQSYTITAGKYSPIWHFFDGNFNYTSFIAHPELNGTGTDASELMAAYNNKLAVGGNYLLSENTTASINGTTLTTCFKNLTFGTKYPIYASLAGDIFVSQINIDGLTSVDNLTQTSTTDLAIYPNPNAGKFVLDIANTSKYTSVEIYNLLGVKVHSQLITAELTTINLDVMSGIYFVTLINNKLEFTTKKIIIQ